MVRALICGQTVTEGKRLDLCLSVYQGHLHYWQLDSRWWCARAENKDKELDLVRSYLNSFESC